MRPLELILQGLTVKLTFKPKVQLYDEHDCSSKVSEKIL